MVKRNVYVCVCACLCVRDGGRDGERERERVCGRVCYDLDHPQLLWREKKGFRTKQGLSPG